MLVVIPDNPIFDYNKIKKMFEENEKYVCSGMSFDEVIKKTHFFAFYEEKNLIGAIFFNSDGERTFVNAFAGKKTHRTNLECLKEALTFYDCDIYAETEHKTAIYCILKCGFKKIGENLYKLERR